MTTTADYVPYKIGGQATETVVYSIIGGTVGYFTWGAGTAVSIVSAITTGVSIRWGWGKNKLSYAQRMAAQIFDQKITELGNSMRSFGIFSGLSFLISIFADTANTTICTAFPTSLGCLTAVIASKLFFMTGIIFAGMCVKKYVDMQREEKNYNQKWRLK